MKLKTFNRENCYSPGGQKYPPAVNINSEGRIEINKTAAEKINLKPGSRVEFSQDQDNPTNWYFNVCKNDGGFILRKRDKGGALVFNAALLARNILDSLELTITSSATINIAPFPEKIKNIEYHPLIASSAKILTTKEK